MLAIASLGVASILGAAAHAGTTPTTDWAQPQIEQVVAAGLMGPDVASFRPDDPLTRGELHDAILALGKPHSAPLDPDRVVTIRELDAQLVGALGLVPSSFAIRLAAQRGRSRADGDAGNRDGRAAARPAHQPSDGKRIARAAPVASPPRAPRQRSRLPAS